jgi:hypothetical protein
VSTDERSLQRRTWRAVCAAVLRGACCLLHTHARARAHTCKHSGVGMTRRMSPGRLG